MIITLVARFGDAKPNTVLPYPPPIVVFPVTKILSKTPPVFMMLAGSPLKTNAPSKVLVADPIFTTQLLIVI